jgi:hypothetical protein
MPCLIGQAGPSTISFLTYADEIRCANTAAAKGRVERAHGTLQDRVVKEMRLEGISPE